MQLPYSRRVSSMEMKKYASLYWTFALYFVLSTICETANGLETVVKSNYDVYPTKQKFLNMKLDSETCESKWLVGTIVRVQGTYSYPDE